MLLGFVGVIFVFIFEKWSLKKIGIRIDNLKASLPSYLLVTLCCFSAIVIASKLLQKEPMANWQIHSFFQYIFFLSALVQEVGFRSFFLTKLLEIFQSPLLAILFHAIVFGVSHLIFPYPFILFLATTGLGIVYGLLYYYRPNLILITLSHAVLTFSIGYYQIIWVSDFMDI